MINLFTRLGMAILFVIPTLCHSQPRLHDSTISALKTMVEGFKERYHSPSVVLAIVHDQEIIFSEAVGYTDVENKIAATVDSRYPILSITKVFTATMLMQIKQRGILKLDDDVRKYIPELNPQLSGNTGITLFQLATHTSGLPRNSQADINFTKQIDRWVILGNNSKTIEPATKKQLLQSLKFINKEYPDYQFLSYGDRNYSNLGYSLLGIAAERAAKTEYTEFVIREICRPLKMTNTGFDIANHRNDILSPGYWYNDSTKAFIRTPTFLSNSAVYAGGMFSSATDLAKFLNFQFDDKTSAGNKILSSKHKTMMQGLRIGWKQSYPFILHEGAMLGYRSQIAFNPDLKVGWVILTNTTDFEFSRMNDFISRMVLPVFNKQTVTDLSIYVGTYKLEGDYDSLRIYLEEGKLYSTYLEKELADSPLVPSGNLKFKGQGKGNYNISYDFIRNKDEKIQFLNMGQLKWIKQ